MWWSGDSYGDVETITYNDEVTNAVMWWQFQRCGVGELKLKI